MAFVPVFGIGGTSDSELRISLATPSRDFYTRFRKIKNLKPTYSFPFLLYSFPHTASNSSLDKPVVPFVVTLQSSS
jgi:hypothetical protein